VAYHAPSGLSTSKLDTLAFQFVVNLLQTNIFGVLMLLLGRVEEEAQRNCHINQNLAAERIADRALDPTDTNQEHAPRHSLDLVQALRVGNDLEVVIGFEGPADFEIDGLRNLGTAATSRLCLAWLTALPAGRTY